MEKQNLKPSEHFMQTEPELPPEFKDIIKDIGGFGPTFVMQKSLSKFDTQRAPCFLHFPVRRNFLTAEERENIHDEMPVLCLDPSLNVREMTLSVWVPDNRRRPLPREMTLSVWVPYNRRRPLPCYRLIENWDSIRKRNGLKTGNAVQIWTFGIEDDELERGFALVKVGKEGPNIKV